MNQPIYFSKIEFSECMEDRRNIILLNLLEKELSYQELKNIWQMPAIQENLCYEIDGKTYGWNSGRPGREIIYVFGEYIFEEKSRRGN